MTQKLAYNWITQQKELKSITRKGQDNIKDTMDALEESGSLRPTEQKLWKDLKYSKIGKNIGDWFWKLIHNRLRSGGYWKNVPSYEVRAYCKYFQNLETMDHILFSCTIEGREQIWEMAEKLYELPMKVNNRLSWTIPSEVLLRGLNSLKLRNANGKYNKQATERYKLIVSETAWLLWKCRNKRVICQKEIQPSQIKGRWKAKMNDRIKIEYVKILKRKEEDKSNSIKSFKER